MKASPIKRKRAMPAPLLTSSPDTLRTSDPDPSPPLPPPGRPVRIVARVVLWALIGIAALHGVLPTPAAPEGSGSSNAPVRSSPDPQSSWSPDSTESQIGMATAATFLREYLTVDGRRAERPGRLERYLARGVDLDDGVVPDRGISQSTDLVLPAGVQATKGGMEVTVLAHLLRIHNGPAQDGGTVAFVVPLVGGPKGIAVGGIPRPLALPIDPGLTARPVALPTALARATAVAAGLAVAAVLNGDRAALVRLGGGAAPAARPRTAWAGAADDLSARDPDATGDRTAVAAGAHGPVDTAQAAAVRLACVSHGCRSLDPELGGRARVHHRVPPRVIRRRPRATRPAACPCRRPVPASGTCARRRHAGGRLDRGRRATAPTPPPGSIEPRARARSVAPAGCPGPSTRGKRTRPGARVSPKAYARRRSRRRAKRSPVTPATSGRSHSVPRLAMPPGLEAAWPPHRARYRMGAHRRSCAGIVLGLRVGSSRSAFCGAGPRGRLERHRAHRSRRTRARESWGPPVPPSEGHCSTRLARRSHGDADDLSRSRRRAARRSGPVRQLVPTAVDAATGPIPQWPPFPLI